MKFDQLRYFLETAKHQHIGKASRALAISPSAISHSISQLEDELGRALFTKRGKNIILTEHGRALQERASHILDEIDALYGEMASEETDLRGHFRFAATHGLAANLLTPSWSGIQDQHANLRAEIYSLRSAQVVHGVLSGEFDLGLCYSPQNQPDLEIRPVHTGLLVFAVRKDHPLTKERGVSALARLSEFPSVFPKAFQGIEVCETHPVFAQFQIRTNPTCLVDNYDVMIEMMARTAFWGFIPDYLAELHRDRVTMLAVPKEWPATYQISFVWKKKARLGLALEKTIQATELALKAGLTESANSQGSGLASRRG